MPGERHHTLVDELERELQQALALEPSPDFTRRVRARIEQRSRRRANFLPGQMMAVAAAVVCAAAIGVAWMMTRNRGEVPVAPPSTVAAVDVTLAFERPERGDERRHPSRAPRSRLADRSATVAEPEIIVPPDRALGLARLLALSRNGEMSEELLPPDVVPKVPATLDVEPLFVPLISIPLVDMKTGAPRRPIDGE